MVERFLRQLSVRRRILGAILIFLLLSALSIPLILNNQAFLTNRLQEVSTVEARSDRLLLLASARLSSSRVNLLRYTQDYAPSAYESIDDVDQAIQLLTEATSLIEDEEQKTALSFLLDAMLEYKSFIEQIEAARQSDRDPEAVELEFQAYRLGNDIGQQIELIVRDSQERVAVTNQTLLQESQNRTILFVAGYGGILVLTLIMGRLLELSITHPVSSLTEGAEAFRSGNFEVSVPVVGSDELSLLSQTFNQMASQLSDLYLGLEKRVADRTRELELRSQYLEASGQVAHTAASILEKEILIQKAVELIQQHFDLYYVGLFEVDETQEWAVLKAGTGTAGKAMLKRQHQLRIGLGSMIGWCIQNAQARITLEAGEDPMRLASEELPNTRSEAAIPLRSRGLVTGAITVQSSQPNAFDEDIITVLQTMADQVAVALDNARLFTESQEALATTVRAYGESSHQAWEDLLKTQPGLAFSCDTTGIKIATDDLLPEGRQAIANNKTIIAEDEHGEQHKLAIPIKVRGHVIGVLETHKSGEFGKWTPEEINLLEELTEQLEIALESARLYRDTQRRAERERLVTDITTKIRATNDPQTMLRTAVSELREALQAHRAQMIIQPTQQEE